MGVLYENFKSIPIDNEEISQSELNIDNKTRSNLFCWNGQFSPQFIETMLKKYAKQDFLVLDPFLGSGTTVSECARLGISAYGVELNVSAFWMAKTYECSNLSLMERWRIVAEVDKIISLIPNNKNILDYILQGIKRNDDIMVTNILSTLVIVMDVYKNAITIELVNIKWEWLKNLILTLPYSEEKICVNRGDSRNIALNDSVADMVITSPPYINVFNYHQKYRRSVEALGYDVLKIARSEFGANRKNRGNRFLTVIQYCIDMALSLNEAIRVCKNGSRMIYVVGRESSVLGYSFCNSELIYNIGKEIFDLKLLLRQEGVFKNRYGQMIYEDIIHFENKKCKISEDEIIEKARMIAIKSLKKKLEIVPTTKNTVFLTEAISKALKVKESEVAYG